MTTHFKKRLIHQLEISNEHISDENSKSPCQSPNENIKCFPMSPADKRKLRVARKRSNCRSKFRHQSLKLIKLGSGASTSLCKSKEPYNSEKLLRTNGQNEKKEAEPPSKEAITEYIINTMADGTKRRDGVLQRRNSSTADTSINTTGHQLPTIIPTRPELRNSKVIEAQTPPGESEEKSNPLTLVRDDEPNQKRKSADVPESVQPETNEDYKTKKVTVKRRKTITDEKETCKKSSEATEVGKDCTNLTSVEQNSAEAHTNVPMNLSVRKNNSNDHMTHISSSRYIHANGSNHSNFLNMNQLENRPGAAGVEYKNLTISNDGRKATDETNAQSLICFSNTAASLGINDTTLKLFSHIYRDMKCHIQKLTISNETILLLKRSMERIVNCISRSLFGPTVAPQVQSHIDQLLTMGIDERTRNILQKMILSLNGNSNISIQNQVEWLENIINAIRQNSAHAFIPQQTQNIDVPSTIQKVEHPHWSVQYCQPPINTPNVFTRNDVVQINMNLNKHQYRKQPIPVPQNPECNITNAAYHQQMTNIGLHPSYTSAYNSFKAPSYTEPINDTEIMRVGNTRQTSKVPLLVNQRLDVQKLAAVPNRFHHPLNTPYKKPVSVEDSSNILFNPAAPNRIGRNVVQNLSRYNYPNTDKNHYQNSIGKQPPQINNFPEVPIPTYNKYLINPAALENLKPQILAPTELITDFGSTQITKVTEAPHQNAFYKYESKKDNSMHLSTNSHIRKIEKHIENISLDESPRDKLNRHVPNRNFNFVEQKNVSEPIENTTDDRKHVSITNISAGKTVIIRDQSMEIRKEQAEPSQINSEPKLMESDVIVEKFDVHKNKGDNISSTEDIVDIIRTANWEKMPEQAKTQLREAVKLISQVDHNNKTPPSGETDHPEVITIEDDEDETHVRPVSSSSSHDSSHFISPKRKSEQTENDKVVKKTRSEEPHILENTERSSWPTKSNPENETTRSQNGKIVQQYEDISSEDESPTPLNRKNEISVEEYVQHTKHLRNILTTQIESSKDNKNKSEIHRRTIDIMPKSTRDIPPSLNQSPPAISNQNNSNKWTLGERHKEFLNMYYQQNRRNSVETISSVGSDYSPVPSPTENTVEIKIDSRWFKIKRALYEKIPKGKMCYIRQTNTLIRYFDDNQMRQFIENLNEKTDPGEVEHVIKQIKSKNKTYSNSDMFIGPPMKNEVIQLKKEVNFAHVDDLADPHLYEAEMSAVEQWIPEDFSGYYKYITGYQIIHNHPPVSFQTFLTMHNTNGIKNLLKKYVMSLIYFG